MTAHAASRPSPRAAYAASSRRQPASARRSRCRGPARVRGELSEKEKFTERGNVLFDLLGVRDEPRGRRRAAALAPNEPIESEKHSRARTSARPSRR